MFRRTIAASRTANIGEGQTIRSAPGLDARVEHSNEWLQTTVCTAQVPFYVLTRIIHAMMLEEKYCLRCLFASQPAFVRTTMKPGPTSH